MPPGTPFVEVARRIALTWRELPEDGKQLYRDAYEQGKRDLWMSETVSFALLVKRGWV